MEIGIREAKNKLSKLIDRLSCGEEVFLTRRGERVAKLVPAPPKKARDPKRGRGFLKGKVNLYPGWDSHEEDKKRCSNSCTNRTRIEIAARHERLPSMDDGKASLAPASEARSGETGF
jgi:prevent-host-death family protein